MEHIVESYSFSPDDLAPEKRVPGISAFMRIRNGADFLEPVIRSYIGHYDEIVAVYNQCTDATPDILRQLQRDHGDDRLKVFHYLPRVFPPGSTGHASEPAESPHSLVNYNNFALSKTTRQIVTKLDDDQLAMVPLLASTVSGIKRGDLPANEMWCHAGLNLSRDELGHWGIPAIAPLVGLGDHWFFRVNRETYFVRDRRFERLRRPGMKRVFVGIDFWHLKYLKAGAGFSAYGIEGGGNTRYARKRAHFMANREVVGIDALARKSAKFSWWRRDERTRIKRGAWRALRDGEVTQANLDAVVARIQRWQADGAAS